MARTTGLVNISYLDLSIDPVKRQHGKFVHPERGSLVLQFLVLGLIVSAMGLCFGTALAVAAGTFSLWLRQGAVAKGQERLTGVVLLGLGVRLALARRD